jgi:hypothetical protein
MMNSIDSTARRAPTTQQVSPQQSPQLNTFSSSLMDFNQRRNLGTPSRRNLPELPQQAAIPGYSPTRNQLHLGMFV